MGVDHMSGPESGIAASGVPPKAPVFAADAPGEATLTKGCVKRLPLPVSSEEAAPNALPLLLAGCLIWLDLAGLLGGVLDKVSAAGLA